MPLKLERKVIQTGVGGLCITLPKGWAAYYNLKTGDKVNIVANGNLIITPMVER